MKLTVLVPSEAYRSSAGVRIRYERLASHLHAAGVSIVLDLIGTFDPATADCDVLLISKCHDARSILAAAALSRRGKLVGVDLFDDYFSQSTDSRLVRYRDWLGQMLQECDFSLCSTEAMARVAHTYRPELAVHVLNDPAAEHDPDEICRLADRKAEATCRARTIRAIWFGVGDNPNFPVGLSDLFAHASGLSELGRTGMAVELTILTNRRALNADGLELIARLPVTCSVLEWSEELEHQVLKESFVAFLPVAAQSFSAAKSLNRAVTALTSGCQILSAGYPLYAGLDPLAYREAAALLADLESRSLRLSLGKAEVYRQKIRAVGSAETEAFKVAEFLRSLKTSSCDNLGRLCVVHGSSTRVEVHKLAQKLGGLSVAGPYCSAKLDFDAIFRGLPPDMEMSVGPRSPRAEREAPLAYQLATYPAVTQEVRRQLEKAFGPLRLIVSETSRIPFFSAEDA